MSKSNIKSVKTPAVEANERVIKLLEDALEVVKRDGVQSIAVVMVDRDLCVNNAGVCGPSMYSLIGGMEELKHEMLADNLPW